MKIGIIFGGKSAEHEVSLQSAKNIVDALDKEKFEPVLIGINKKGHWHIYNIDNYLLNAEDPKLIELNKSAKSVAIIPGIDEGQLIHTNSKEVFEQIDVIFPIVHGTLGEDGSLQGLLRMANLPFVGPSVLSSAICMDKDIAKQLLHSAGILVAKGLVYSKVNKSDITYQTAKNKLGVPIFIKPANQGSSVGVSKVETEEEFNAAIDLAFQFDHKVVIEECIHGREIECSVLGNDQPIASLPGEILPNTEFYSYESKYIDEKGAELAAPADLSEEQVKKVQQTAIHAFKTLQCEGLARVEE